MDYGLWITRSALVWNFGPSTYLISGAGVLECLCACPIRAPPREATTTTRLGLTQLYNAKLLGRYVSHSPVVIVLVLAVVVVVGASGIIVILEDIDDGVPAILPSLRILNPQSQIPLLTHLAPYSHVRAFSFYALNMFRKHISL